MSRAILPKLTAKWDTISNLGPLNKGVSEQIRQTVWINKQQNPDLEITAEMLTRPVTDAAAAPAAPGGARRRRRTADATADGGGGLPAEDSIAAGNVAAGRRCWQRHTAADSAAAGTTRSLAPTAGPSAHCGLQNGCELATGIASSQPSSAPPPVAAACVGTGHHAAYSAPAGSQLPPPSPPPPAAATGGGGGGRLAAMELTTASSLRTRNGSIGRCAADSKKTRPFLPPFHTLLLPSLLPPPPSPTPLSIRKCVPNPPFYLEMGTPIGGGGNPHPPFLSGNILKCVQFRHVLACGMNKRGLLIQG